ncbi:alpha-amylase family glycosyl hydrolase [Mycoplasmopsis cynos]|uniref:alpha-amylase family glycosyl hydrolase n=1 Tax=Mycoplasmopsis cynos TaxID=171284 RepID=UPI002AFF0FE3|nr:alpha-amylase family glycosyl hydrolase [Mycoplasmopsis cynos]WQQ17674.1 alpha-amylase family glycosyl hydrolase [Mycoplasmopsis cynos]
MKKWKKIINKCLIMTATSIITISNACNSNDTELNRLKSELLTSLNYLQYPKENDNQNVIAILELKKKINNSTKENIKQLKETINKLKQLIPTTLNKIKNLSLSKQKIYKDILNSSHTVSSLESLNIRIDNTIEEEKELISKKINNLQYVPIEKRSKAILDLNNKNYYEMIDEYKYLLKENIVTWVDVLPYPNKKANAKNKLLNKYTDLDKQTDEEILKIDQILAKLEAKIRLKLTEIEQLNYPDSSNDPIAANYFKAQLNEADTDDKVDAIFSKQWNAKIKYWNQLLQKISNNEHHQRLLHQLKNTFFENSNDLEHGDLKFLKELYNTYVLHYAIPTIDSLNNLSKNEKFEYIQKINPLQISESEINNKNIHDKLIEIENIVEEAIIGHNKIELTPDQTTWGESWSTEKNKTDPSSIENETTVLILDKLIKKPLKISSSEYQLILSNLKPILPLRNTIATILSLNNIDELKGTSGDQYNKPWLISKDLLKPNAFTDEVLNEVKESQSALHVRKLEKYLFGVNGDNPTEKNDLINKIVVLLKEDIVNKNNEKLNKWKSDILNKVKEFIKIYIKSNKNETKLENAVYKYLNTYINPAIVRSYLDSKNNVDLFNKENELNKLKSSKTLLAWGDDKFVDIIRKNNLSNISYIDEASNVQFIAPYNKDAKRSNVMYQLTVYSFADGNNDGIGDFIGLKNNLDYFVNLGIDTLYLSPIHPASSYHGYDVIDYTDVAPELGGMKAFDEFLIKAHEKGIRVVLDMVFNHTSYEHPWFQKALKNDPKYKNFYYIYDHPKWTDQNQKNQNKEGSDTVRHFFRNVYDAKDPSKNPANTNYNWAAEFWSGMPDLNLNNPDVIEELKNVHRFWAKKGVDGFRYDAFYHYFDSNNPIKGKSNKGNEVELFKEFRKVINQEYKNAEDQKVSRSSLDAFMFGEWWESPEGENAKRNWFSKNGNDKALSSLIDGSRWKLNPNVGISWKDELYLIDHLTDKNGQIREWLPFLDNHDVERWITQYRYSNNDHNVTEIPHKLTEFQRAGYEYALVNLLSRGGLPTLYNGNEILMQGGPKNKTDANVREAF